MATIAELARRVRTATSLEGLFEAWREHDAACDEAEADPQHTLDTSSLPTFGGAAPESTVDVWSWDQTRLLVGSCAEDAEIVSRADWESGSEEVR